MKISGVNVGFDTDIIITIKVPLIERESLTGLFEEINNFQDYADYTLTLEKTKRPRSLDANSYMWALCDKIAQAVRNTTKEEVYRRAIREVGVFSDVAVQEEAYEELVKTWNKNGIGYFSEVFDSMLTDKDGNPMKRVRLYHGSHNYNQKQLSRVIDWVVDECKRLDIQVLTERKIKEMEASWKN